MGWTAKLSRTIDGSKIPSRLHRAPLVSGINLPLVLVSLLKAIINTTTTCPQQAIYSLDKIWAICCPLPGLRTSRGGFKRIRRVSIGRASSWARKNRRRGYWERAGCVSQSLIVGDDVLTERESLLVCRSSMRCSSTLDAGKPRYHS